MVIARVKNTRTENKTLLVTVIKFLIWDLKVSSEPFYNNVYHKVLSTSQFPIFNFDGNRVHKVENFMW